MAKKSTRMRKPTKLEEITVATRQNWSDQSSDEIMSERARCAYEVSLAEDAIANYQLKLVKLRKQVVESNAKILGLTLILDRRC